MTTEEKIAIIDRYHSNPEQILNILVDIQFQSEAGYIDQQTAQLVAEKLDISETRVYEIVSFYAILKETPQARYVLKICDSSPCHFSGEPVVSQWLQEKLGVGENQMTQDGLFMYHGIPCVGACAQTPFVKIKGEVFPHLTPEKLEKLLADLKAGYYPELVGGESHVEA
ncbi:putative NAD-dependent formate dehydrogenase, gamma subunit [Agrilactobacillus composti DSM 18527 = JCM 14202]|jgi:NADH-quinone oxidoreductase subunit E|uniref:Putative NAD-dependent formate dehydrogenase, gamma subunit n=1 Tax=Agrilactobacillus composti DSM 18527 = JCM 14202 TaxID=1423734 RepID=X0PMZ8_9LACO|nr:NAD(P)H-dependent oxidoreductase subunit E [Agrilactobacillus composti]KRM30637.1 putative NAD-dependent formate dehydrogenase, gamma subunit [Agrilactobacillus composti DSM 18527 = JCM 14202]MCH4170733.1 NAD(P)H-dependent oxidoreductase subunit E [Lactobacillus sp.]GAF38271.1 NADH-ubiquinone oxidoreductase chain E [Agrilactobacillus composti DSM 18527 = JCM 14202]